MKQLLSVFFLFCFVQFSVAQEINWVSLDKAMELQEKEPRKIMIDMYTSWCGPCKMLDKNTFHNKDVVEYVNNNYYAVKFNAEGDDTVTFKGNTYTNPEYDPARARTRNSAHQLARYFQITAYPTIVFLDEEGTLLVPLRGYKTPQQLELYLKMFKNNDHKGMTSQEEFNEYYKSFKNEFTN
ncbi:thioredoxin family protein [Mangrovimonas aestuarii]|uniref:thioredoxin family protein n=1 Tax=Mangrovimonas aestuarii TaxID=3018443 RepID=UPI002378D235|nr:thioredoxin fold domain-containing protein [Mangrovimonas aestuarii]